MFEHTQQDVDEYGHTKQDIPANTFMLAGRLGYRIELWNDRISWNIGLATGGAYLHYDHNDLFMPIISADITLNIRLTKRLYLEAAPLIFLPPVSTFYYSFKNYAEYTDYYGINVFPIGVRYKF